MSAALRLLPQVLPHVLPQVWETASARREEPFGAIAVVAGSVQQRKGPHRLHLVQACEEVALQPVRTQRDEVQSLAFYRKYTEALLRRYMKLSLDCGRTPSLLGRELFRGKVANYKVHGFDDAVIFVHDVGGCLQALNPGLRHLVRRIGIEEYTFEETAAMLGISLRNIMRRYVEAIDKLTRLLLDKNLMKPGSGEIGPQ